MSDSTIQPQPDTADKSAHLRIVREGLWTSWRWHVFAGDNEITSIKFFAGLIGARPTWELDGCRFEFSQNWWSREFTLWSSRKQISRAVKRCCRREFDVEFGGLTYSLKRRFWFRNRFVLQRGAEALGWVEQIEFGASDYHSCFPASFPCAIRVFRTWIVVAQIHFPIFSTF